MNEEKRRKILGEFLSHCRNRIQPADVGLPSTRRRRTPGLRREEVAVLSGISQTYYVKIEQGRLDVSLHVLDAIIDVLKLNLVEREYAYTLATGHTKYRSDVQYEEIDEALHLVLNNQGANPAYIMGRCWDILAWNDAASALLGNFEKMTYWERNTLVQMFTKKINRQLIDNWELHAKNILAEFRANYADYHDDPAFKKLIVYLKENSEEFLDWWDNFDQVGAPPLPKKKINHPLVGELFIYQMSFYVDHLPNLRMIIYLPVNEETKEKFQQLCEMRLEQQHQSIQSVNGSAK